MIKIILFVFIFIVFFISTVFAQSFKVMTYNIRHGLGIDNVIDTNRIVEVIKKVNPHFLALQELDKETTRVARVNQPAVLAQKLGMHYVFAPAMNFMEGEYGIAFFSTEPIKSWKTIPLLGANDEPRVLLIVTTSFKEKTLVFFVSHFTLDEEVVNKHISLLEEYLSTISNSNQEIIFMGDLNFTPDSPQANRLRNNFIFPVSDFPTLLTYPAPNPTMQIDFILQKKSPLSHIRLNNIFSIYHPTASDHFPLIANFEVLNLNIN
ncbi:MAG: endonuclease/exonuclease/phosphatase family protein [Oligoflexia bacterium]|nr:endonuclease/exonuclease/phosphatase family protein [Oligoflexia bacterium]